MDRKKARGEWGREKRESVGKEGWVEWGDGVEEGLRRTGGEMERRWRNGE